MSNNGINDDLSPEAKEAVCMWCEMIYRRRHDGDMITFNAEWMKRTVGQFEGWFCTEECFDQWTEEQARLYHGDRNNPCKDHDELHCETCEIVKLRSVNAKLEAERVRLSDGLLAALRDKQVAKDEREWTSEQARLYHGGSERDAHR